MTLDDLNTFCATLAATHHVVQWGDHDVWKVGIEGKGKVFAIAGTQPDGHLSVSFKVSDMAFEILRDHPDCRPAPYLASRGMKWIQYYTGDQMTDDEVRDLLQDSHRLVAAGLPKKTQKELGL
ncbi:MmcQ/YjbR family DNA-binding protein [Asticcacaulis sp. BYS171W]|uniref:MmcQ/YjbR family DNA-binding protein n=1 Tax=Asticcacaulis aquaticus TaxID=2984212 RepID=A0ABT5HWP5_9CAUL|nr:MmcQ/YjbR family DNA-binding protein [Asticcacaulis aquaticus]MDC7683856.1 MmcQ/YjbR family DNA-binding protein [Asticcacaulis aquaticus]